MTSLFRAAAELQAFFRVQSWEFCFIGGIALQRWGEPRLTVDVDVTLLAGLGQESRYVDLLCARYQPRIPDARAFALANRVVLLEDAGGIPLDIALGAFAFEGQAVRRATDFEFLKNVVLRTCSAEDLVVLKAFADRSRDWADIEGILIRQGASLDRSYIVTHLRSLCEIKEAPKILAKLDDLLNRFS